LKSWLGDIRSGAIAPAYAFVGNRAVAAWLPDEITAKRWKEYTLRGTVAPVTAPAPPVSVRAVRDAATDSVEVTWDAATYFGAPIPAFRIYRDGAIIGTIPPPTHGYGDEPQPALWRPRYIESGSPSLRVRASIYAVAAVGASGVESARVPARVTVSRRPAAVGALPDLVVTRMEWSPLNPAAGEPVTLRATVRNRGTATTPTGVPISAAFCVDRSASIGSWVEGPLPPGGEVVLEARTVPTEKVWTAVSGDHAVTVEADELDRIRESDDQNNVLQQMLTIPSKK
jgi:hypothetical protein